MQEKFAYIKKKQYFCKLFRVKSTSLLLTRVWIRVIRSP